MSNELTFRRVSEANLARCNHWHPGGITDWGVVDWSNAMAGEAGEVCNAVKKLRRLETDVNQNVGPQDRAAAIEAIATEIGDTFIYLDLLAQRLEIDIAEAIVRTFNRVSDREGLDFRLEMPAEDRNDG